MNKEHTDRDTKSLLGLCLREREREIKKVGGVPLRSMVCSATGPRETSQSRPTAAHLDEDFTRCLCEQLILQRDEATANDVVEGAHNLAVSSNRNINPFEQPNFAYMHLSCKHILRPILF